MPAIRRLAPSGLSAAAAIAALLLAGNAQAASPETSLRMTVEKPRFTCEGHGVTMSHVLFRDAGKAAGAGVLPCCNGQLGCAQFLSTRTVLHGPHPWHS